MLLSDLRFTFSALPQICRRMKSACFSDIWMYCFKGKIFSFETEPKWLIKTVHNVISSLRKSHLLSWWSKSFLFAVCPLHSKEDFKSLINKHSMEKWQKTFFFSLIFIPLFSELVCFDSKWNVTQTCSWWELRVLLFCDRQILMNKFLSNVHEERVLVETIRIHLLT